MDIYQKTNSEIKQFTQKQYFTTEKFSNDGEKFRFVNEPKMEAKEYKKLLETRKKQIECVIDDHFNEVSSLNFQRFRDEYNYEEKLEFLFTEQQLITQKDKERLRLNQLIQSFDMFSSELYLQLKPIKTLMEKHNFKFKLTDEDIEDETEDEVDKSPSLKYGRKGSLRRTPSVVL